MAHPAVQTRDNTEARPATARNAVLWALQIVVAALFLMSGFTKLTGVPEMVALFEAIGAGQWLRHLTGALEMGGAALLLAPGRSGIGGGIVKS